MSALEIIVIVSSVLVVLAVVSNYIYKRVKNIPTGECANCSNKTRANKMFKDIRKELNKERCNCK